MYKLNFNTSTTLTCFMQWRSPHLHVNPYVKWSNSMQWALANELMTSTHLKSSSLMAHEFQTSRFILQGEKHKCQEIWQKVSYNPRGLVHWDIGWLPLLSKPRFIYHYRKRKNANIYTGENCHIPRFLWDSQINLCLASQSCLFKCCLHNYIHASKAPWCSEMITPWA